MPHVTRNRFLHGLAVAVAASAFALRVRSGEDGGIERIETKNAILSLRAGSGDWVGVQWKHPKLDLIKNPRLGQN